MSYDSACYTLAEHFLPAIASERLKAALAQAVQSCVEDWLTFECSRLATELGVPDPEAGDER